MQINDFFDTISVDPRIGTSHIAIYLALVHVWELKNRPETFEVTTYEMMKLVKCRKRDTYLLRLRDLADFGYIKYTTAENEHVPAVIGFKRL